MKAKRKNYHKCKCGHWREAHGHTLGDTKCYAWVFIDTRDGSRLTGNCKCEKFKQF